MGFSEVSVSPVSYSPLTQVDTPPGARGQHRCKHRQQEDHLHRFSHLAPPPPPKDSSTAAWSAPSAMLADTEPPPRTAPPEAPSACTEAGDVLLVDLGSRSLVKEDLEKALRLWTRPAILIAGRNSLEQLPANVPETILFLDLSWNRLVSFKGFSALPNLRELDVSHNSAQDMLGLASNVDLRVLRISHNCIRRIEGLHQLKRLEEADFSHNLLRTKADVRALSLNAALRRLRIEGNPFCATGVQHGTYQIAMQHLLPGMRLLDGKAPSALSTPLSSTLPLPPPLRPLQPGSSTTHDYTQGRGEGARRSSKRLSSHLPNRRYGREGLMASTSLDFAGDLSVERRWRDSEVAAGGSASPRMTENPERSARPGNPIACGAGVCAGVGGGMRCVSDGGGCRRPHITVTTGGGGPTVAPGSYAEIFVAMLRREHPSSTKNDDHAAAAATAAAMKTNRAIPAAGPSASNKGLTAHHQAGHSSGAAQHAAAGTAAHAEPAYHPSRRDNASAAPGTGVRVSPLATARDAPDTAGPASAQAASLLSYRGMSRAERGAARRQAWSQARQEGVLGDAGVGAQRHRRRRMSFRKATKSTLGDGDVAKGKRAVDRGRPLEPIVASARERSSPATEPTRRSRRTDNASSGVANPRRQSKGATLRRAGDTERVGPRRHGPNSSTVPPGATRQSTSSRRQRQPVPSAAADGRGGGLWHRASQGATATTRDRGSGARAGGGAGGSGYDDGGKQGPSSSPTASGSGRSGQGQRPRYRFKTTLGKRCGHHRPLAPVASPWTPRDDAKPWDWDGGRESTHEGENNGDCGIFANGTPTNHEDYHGSGGSDDCGGGFVSPLSTAGILHRVSSSRRSSATAGVASLAAAVCPTTESAARAVGQSRSQWAEGQRGKSPHTKRGAHGRRGDLESQTPAPGNESADGDGGRHEQTTGPIIPLPSEHRQGLHPVQFDGGKGSERGHGDASASFSRSSNSAHGISRRVGRKGGGPRDHHHERQQRRQQRHQRPHPGVKAKTRRWNSPTRRLHEEEETTTDSTASVGLGDECLAGAELLPRPARRGVALDEEGCDEQQQMHDQLLEERGRHLDSHFLPRYQGVHSPEIGTAVTTRRGGGAGATNTQHRQQQGGQQLLRRRRSSDDGGRRRMDNRPPSKSYVGAPVDGEGPSTGDTLVRFYGDGNPSDGERGRGGNADGDEQDDDRNSGRDDPPYRRGVEGRESNRGGEPQGREDDDGDDDDDDDEEEEEEEEEEEMEDGGLEVAENWSRRASGPTVDSEVGARAREATRRRAAQQQRLQEEEHRRRVNTYRVEMAGESAEEVVAFENEVMDMLSFMVGGHRRNTGGQTQRRSPRHQEYQEHQHQHQQQTYR